MKLSNKKWRKTRAYKEWRRVVLDRDKVCCVCGSSLDLEAHHMNCMKYFPGQREDIDNGITLCGKHHSIFHNSYKSSFRQKCTKKEFKNFLELLERMGFWEKKDE